MVAFIVVVGLCRTSQGSVEVVTQQAIAAMLFMVRLLVLLELTGLEEHQEVVAIRTLVILQVKKML